MSGLGGGPTSLPMFPLGSPLLPSMLLPLRVFEPRYRALVRDVLDGDGAFGVVMIERGSEVGGGDVRAGVGCLASVVRAEPLANGEWMLICVGSERLRVVSWDGEEPYPRATVEAWPDPAGSPDPPLDALLARFHSLMARLDAIGGRPAGAPAEGLVLADDATTAIFQMAIVSPLGALDRYRVLCAEGAVERVALLKGLLDDAEELLEAEGGTDPSW